MFTLKRNRHNPIIKPDPDTHWEAVATFNWSPVRLNNEYHVFYRAMAKPDFLMGPNLSISTIGTAVSKDGVHYEEHRQFIVPDNEWEMYGCEDPRATYLENKIIVFYTALSVYPFRHEGIKTAVAISDDGKKILEKHEVTPFNSKAMTVFPEKINGKYLALVTVHPDLPPSSICFAEFEKLEDMWSMDYWRSWYARYKEFEFKLIDKEDEHVEIGAAPIKTGKGWLLLYSHIYNYFTEDKIFGVEAALLDLNDPRKVIKRTSYPFMVPETYYEKHGEVPNIVFPSGALTEDPQKVNLYYGGADTVCCLAKMNIEHLLDSIGDNSYNEAVTRYDQNPIIRPRDDHPWENYCVFNPGAIEIDGKIHILYRAMGQDNTSVMGYASTTDGFKLDERLDVPVYVPRADFESKKKPPNGFSGCEDPRLTLIGDKIYMVYTAYDGVSSPKIAVTSILKNDFVNKIWNWAMPQLISPMEMDDKDGCIFPDKINEQYVIMHRLNRVICIDYFDDLDFEKHKLDRCIQLIGPRRGMWDSVKVGIAGVPIKTPYGWVMFYHGVSEDSIYRIGAVLLELENPANVIARTADYFFEPKMDYEKQGSVPNVVFPCSNILRGDTVYLYYGGADSVIGVATMDFNKLLDRLLA